MRGWIDKSRDPGTFQTLSKTFAYPQGSKLCCPPGIKSSSSETMNKCGSSWPWLICISDFSRIDSFMAERPGSSFSGGHGRLVP